MWRTASIMRSLLSMKDCSSQDSKWFHTQLGFWNLQLIGLLFPVVFSSVLLTTKELQYSHHIRATGMTNRMPCQSQKGLHMTAYYAYPHRLNSKLLFKIRKAEQNQSPVQRTKLQSFELTNLIHTNLELLKLPTSIYKKCFLVPFHPLADAFFWNQPESRGFR